MDYTEGLKKLGKKRIQGEITQAQYLSLIQQLKKRFGEKILETHPTTIPNIPNKLPFNTHVDIDITDISAVVSFFGETLDNSNTLG